MGRFLCRCLFRLVCFGVGEVVLSSFGCSSESASACVVSGVVSHVTSSSSVPWLASLGPQTYTSTNIQQLLIDARTVENSMMCYLQAELFKFLQMLTRLEQQSRCGIWSLYCDPPAALLHLDLC